MNATYYFIHEVKNVLFAHPISARLASQFNRTGSIALAALDDLVAIARYRQKRLHVVNAPTVGGDARLFQRASA